MIRSALLIALSLFMIVAASCDNETDPRRDTGVVASNSGLDDVYARMEQALAAGDKIVHASVIIEDIDLGGSPTPDGLDYYDFAGYAEQIWLDVGNNAARTETRSRGQSDSKDQISRLIARSGETFRVDPDGVSNSVDSLTCRGSESPLLALLMRCGNYLEESDTRVDEGEYNGRAAIILVTSGTLPSHDWSSSFTTRLYLDPSSYLPVGREEQQSGGGDRGELSYRIKQRYDIEILSRSSIPADFFEPASIGFVEKKPIPADNLRPDVNGMIVYWIGTDFDAGVNGTVVLGGAVIYPGESSPGPRASMGYSPVDDQARYRGVLIREYPIGLGDQTEADVLGEWDKSDTVREEVTVQGRRAELLRLFNTRNGEIYMIRIDFETTTVVVNDYFGPPPYTGRDAMLRIAAALRPYEE